MCALTKQPLEIEARLLAGWRPRAFVALDFETANRSNSSACAVALVRGHFRPYPVEAEVFERWLTSKDEHGQYLRTAAWICQKTWRGWNKF